MNVGDYVRTECGIAKIKEFETKNKEVINLDKDIMICNMDCYRNCCTINQVIKSSPNIIDLLKKKDIVIDYKGNMYQVVKVWKDYVFTDKKNKYGQVITLVDYQIESIVTHEQFESMKYEV